MDVKQVQAGGILSKIIYAKVLSIHKADIWHHLQVECRDLDDGTTFYLEGAELIGTCLSGDHFDREVDVSLTKLAEEFTKVGTRPFTVTYIKKNGEVRTLRGRMLTPDNVLGRSTVLDFDVDKGSPLRQVDHRTLQSLVVSGVKYTVRRGK